MIGQRVGPYAVVERLGGGGMGEVYLAEDTRLGRRVALKTSVGIVSERPRCARAPATAKPARPAVSPIPTSRRSTTCSTSTPTRTSSWSTSRARASRRCSPAVRSASSVALALGLQVADALAAAHARGVIHRDLKPGNIAVTAEGIAKVLDFGIAKGPGPGSSHSSPATPPLNTITVAGQTMGTPGYSSPEQLVGAGADPRDDIYSLGVVLYELLTGRRPFEGADALELAVATMTKTAPLPHQLNPAVPPEVSQVIARAIARDRDNRYGSALDLREELRRVSRTLSSSVTGPISTSTPASDRTTLAAGLADRPAAGRELGGAAGTLVAKHTHVHAGRPRADRRGAALRQQQHAGRRADRRRDARRADCQPGCTAGHQRACRSRPPAWRRPAAPIPGSLPRISAPPI